MPRNLRSLSQTLGKILDRRRDDERDITPKAVQGRNTDGTLQLRGQDGECVLRGEIGANTTGQVVNTPPSPTFASRGLGGGTLSGTAAGSTIWVERIEPPQLPRGRSMTVKVFGRGLATATRFEFGLRGLTRFVNPDITITGQRSLDPEGGLEVVELDIEIAVDASLRVGSLFYDR